MELCYALSRGEIEYRRRRKQNNREKRSNGEGKEEYIEKERKKGIHRNIPLYLINILFIFIYI